MDAETAMWLAAALCGVTGGIVLGAALWRRYRPSLPTPTLQPPTTWAELSRQFGIDPIVRPVDDGRSLTEKMRACTVTFPQATAGWRADVCLLAVIMPCRTIVDVDDLNAHVDGCEHCQRNGIAWPVVGKGAD